MKMSSNNVQPKKPLVTIRVCGLQPIHHAEKRNVVARTLLSLSSGRKRLELSTKKKKQTNAMQN